MTPLLVVWIALAGGLGALLRHLLDVALQRRGASPRATMLLVNVAGSLALGYLTTHGSPTARLVWGAGLCGGLTTFSTAVLQSARLATDPARPGRARPLVSAAGHAVGMLALCCAAAWVGTLVG